MEKWELENLARDHCRKMSYSIKTDKGIEYHNFMTYEDYKASLIEGMGSLGYPLRKQIKRDRYVLNSEGLRRTMEKACVMGVQEMEKDINNFIQKDVKEEISKATEDVLNSISWNGSSFKTNSKPSELESHLMMMATQLGKNLANNIMYIFNDMMNGGTGKKKRKQ